MSHIMTFRMSDKEYQKLYDIKTKTHKSISAIIRNSVFKSKIYMVDGLPELTSQILKIGNNLNQIARIMNNNPNSKVINSFPYIQRDFNQIKQEIEKIGEKICQS